MGIREGNHRIRRDNASWGGSPLGWHCPVDQKHPGEPEDHHSSRRWSPEPLAFSDGDVYSVSFTMQAHIYPDRLEFQLCREKDIRSYTERRQTGAKERRRNQDHLLTFVKRLLTIEPAPYTRLHVSKYNDSPKYSRSTGFTSTGFLCFEYHGGSIPGQAALAAVLDV